MSASRRGVIAALAVAPLSMCAQPAHASPARVRPMFQRKIDRARRLSKAAGEFDDGPRLEAERRYEELVAQIPHTTTESMGTNLKGESIVWSTAVPHQVAMAKSFVDRPVANLSAEYVAGCECIVAACGERSRLKAEAGNLSGYDVAFNRSDKFADLVCEAEWAVIRTRVVSAAELHLKLQFMADWITAMTDREIAAIYADVEALAGAAS